MKELEYPFDSAWILQKRRKLKKQLLEDGSTRIKKKIAVLGGSTTSDIIAIMELFLLNAGIEPEFYESEYARYWQDAMFENPELMERIRHVLAVQLEDNMKARLLQSDGTYTRVDRRGKEPICAQDVFCREAVAAAYKAAPRIDSRTFIPMEKPME